MFDETTFDDLHEQIARNAITDPKTAAKQALALARETYVQAHAAIQRLQAELAAATTTASP